MAKEWRDLKLKKSPQELIKWYELHWVNKDAKDEDCTINYGLDEVTGKINPNTGSNLPYALIGGGALLAAGIYVLTRKKTKLYKI